MKFAILFTFLCLFGHGMSAGIYPVANIEKGIEILKNVAEKANPLEEKITQASMNAYMDIVCMMVGPWINSLGWIPMPLPDIETLYEVQPIWITYSAELWLWDGMLERFDQVIRQGNSMMYYDRMLLRVSVGTAMVNVQYRYDYRTRVMDLGILGQSGWVEGGTDKLVIYADFMVDVTDFWIYMQDFRVDSVGSIWTKLHGNILTDWLSNALINTMTFIFRGLLTDVVSVNVKNNVQAIIDEINYSLHPQFKNVSEVEQFLQDFAANGFGIANGLKIPTQV